MRGPEAAGPGVVTTQDGLASSATLVLSDVVSTLTSRKDSCNDQHLNQTTTNAGWHG
jgi:hypothetical protein